MRILLATHGTRGDVQPLVALAIALRTRGHDVAFLTPANFVDWIASYGFRCESDGIDVEAMLRRPDFDFTSVRSPMRYMNDVAPALFDAMERASAGADLILGAGVLIIAASSIADLRGVPYASAVFCPCAIPSSLAPPIRWQHLPAPVNRLIWRGIGLGFTVMLGRSINACRARYGLPPIHNPIGELTRRSIIVAADSELAPMPPDAPSAATQTDAWILDQRGDLDPAIDAFIRDGPPPIYVGFGSMVTKRLDRLVSILARVADTCRCRMIVAGGWAELHDRMASSPGVLVIDRAPHDALFPRVGAVVHHGGAGTTTAAARAGVPQILLPHLLDQYYWADRIEILGLGPASLPVARVTAEALAGRLRHVLDDPRYRTRAQEVGPRVAARNGVAAAAELLEQLHARCRA